MWCALFLVVQGEACGARDAAFVQRNAHIQVHEVGGVNN